MVVGPEAAEMFSIEPSKVGGVVKRSISCANEFAYFEFMGSGGTALCITITIGYSSDVGSAN